jgi:hypothetical protein
MVVQWSKLARRRVAGPGALKPTSMKPLSIVALCICSVLIYGIIHDQITARICVEYFTIGHPPVFNTDSPTLLGLGWGVIATWWVGLIIGVPLAMVARLGSRPKRTATSLIRPLAILLIIMACFAALSGTIGYVLARKHLVALAEPMAFAVPFEKHVTFIADLWSHLASYIVRFVGGIVLIVIAWKSRQTSYPEQQ